MRWLNAAGKWWYYIRKTSSGHAVTVIHGHWRIDIAVAAKTGGIGKDGRLYKVLPVRVQLLIDCGHSQRTSYQSRLQSQ
jgi:hypothetical protein